MSRLAWSHRLRALPGAAATMAVVAAAALPVLVTAGSILDPSPAVWRHLWATRLPGMLVDTVVLLVAVVLGTVVLGTFLAWLVTAWQFPGRRVLGWLLVTPLAVPGYVLGYVWLETLQDPLGPRAVRSLWLCAIVLVLTLYPYVYLFARAAFREQSGRAFDVGRSLGCTRVQVWWRVVLAMSRPSLAAGAALVGMEVLSDVGTVRLFNVSTVADGVLRVWFGTGDRDAATELSVSLIVLAIVLLAVERFTRGRARYAHGDCRSGIVPQQLGGWRAGAAAAAGWGVLAIAVAVPIARLLTWAVEARRSGQTVTVAGDLGFHLQSSLIVTGLAAIACLTVGLVLAATLDPRRRVSAVAARLATLGYVVPGPVVAIGAVVVLAALDRSGWLPRGTLLVGSLAGLVYALVVRFVAVAHQGIESSFGKVPSSAVDSARTLGAGRLRVVTGVMLPLSASGIMAAGVVMAIDILKDLPITLLLRPFGTETLPVWVWQATSESLWVQASVPSLALVAVGMVLVGALVWAFERGTTPASSSVVDPTLELGTAEGEARTAHPGRGGTVRGATAGALTLEGVSRRIGPTAIITDVSFEVAHGELVVLVGPSGCGKTTLLRVIAGLDPACEGRISLAGADITARPAERRRIGLVFQDDALLPHRRIRENLAFGIRHLPRSARARRVEELLDLVRLPGMGDRYPHELSGGERQRIALARALAPDPAVVLLDEPFANLDPSLREGVRHDVIAALRQRATTAILVTHERDEALAFGDRVAVMGGGRLHQLDRPEAVYDRPADRFVAGFLGEASFLPCATAGDGRGASCRRGCVVVVRPPDLSIEPGGDGLVTGRRYLGSAWRYEVRGADGASMRVDGTAAPPLAVGTPCTVTVTADRPLHHLPAA